MIKYICNNCDNLICESSTCPVCNSIKYIDKSKIYCNIPLFNDVCAICRNGAEYIKTDLKLYFYKKH